MRTINFTVNSLALAFYENNFIGTSKVFLRGECENLDGIFGLFTSMVDEVKIVPLPEEAIFLKQLNLVNDILDYVEHGQVNRLTHYCIYKG